MRKTVAFGAKPNRTADAWVAGQQDAAAVAPEAKAGDQPAEPMKRFTIDVPKSLHTRIKLQCVQRGMNMADAIRALLEEHFPDTP